MLLKIKQCCPGREETEDFAAEKVCCPETNEALADFVVICKSMQPSHTHTHTQTHTHRHRHTHTPPHTHPHPPTPLGGVGCSNSLAMPGGCFLSSPAISARQFLLGKQSLQPGVASTYLPSTTPPKLQQYMSGKTQTNKNQKKSPQKSHHNSFITQREEENIRVKQYHKKKYSA